MDAVAVALCEGLAMKKPRLGRMVLIAVFFGGFQALMPFIGAYLGEWFSVYIERWSAYIAFGLLLLIGVKMIYDAIRSQACEQAENAKIGRLFLLAIATSIDALAVGITLPALWSHSIVSAVLIIGCTTFVLSFVGVWIGNCFGIRFKKGAEIAGGAVLIALGIKILLEKLIG